MGFSLGGPGREGQGPLLHEPRVHPRPQHRHADHAGSRRPSSSRRARRRRRRSSAPTAAAPRSTARSSPAATCSAIVGTAAGPFNSLPGRACPSSARSTSSSPIDAGGGDPQDKYQFVGRLDFSLSSATQAYVRYAYQNQEAQPGTNSVEPLRRVRHGLPQQEPQRPRLADPRLLADASPARPRSCWNRLLSDQPLNGDPQPTLYMNPTTAVRLQGYRIALPGLPALEPRHRDPVRRPAAAAAALPGLQLGEGQARHPVRRLLHPHEGRPHVRRLRERGRGPQHHLSRAALARQLRPRPASGGSRAPSTRDGYPGGTYTTPVGFPSFTSNNTLQRVRGLRQRHVERHATG